jgi:hypothetical protein
MPGAGLRTAAVAAERRRQGADAEEGRRGADAEEEEEEMAAATLHHPKGVARRTGQPPISKESANGPLRQREILAFDVK